MQDLKGTLILDFTSRLPGPLGLSLLARRGARVVKIEALKRGDPFKETVLDSKDHSFHHWYKEINQNKEIIEFDFETSDFQTKLAPYLKSADALVAPQNDFMQGLFKDTQVPVTLFLKASEHSRTPLHDLNILAQAGLLDLHARGAKSDVIAPPFLPVAGVSFASSLALDLLSALYQFRASGKRVVFESSLESAVTEQLSVLFPPALAASGERLFLHNGNYPCYNIYRTKDQHAVALACIEESYWVRFCQIFDCPLRPLDRFSARERDPRPLALVRDLFAGLKLTEVQALLLAAPDGEQICVTPFALHR